MPTEVSYIWRKNTPHRRVASVAMQQACNMNSFDKRPSICSSSHSMVDARSKVAARRIPRCRPTPRPRNRAKGGAIRKRSQAFRGPSVAFKSPSFRAFASIARHWPNTDENSNATRFRRNKRISQRNKRIKHPLMQRYS